MKKPKIGFGEGGFQGFMSRHVEKCVLVAVILLMAWFIYSGAGSSGVTITRDKLKQNAQDAESNITKSSWDTVAPDRAPRTNPYEIILQQKDRIDSRAYATTSWDHPLVPRLMPRLDPKLIAAEKVIATPFYGPLVLALPEDEDVKTPPDPLEKLPITLGGTGGFQGATDEEKDEKKKSRRAKDKDKDKEKSSPMGSMGSMGPPPGTSSSGSGKSKPKKGDDPYSPSASGGMSNYGGNMGGGTTGRAITPEATQGIKASTGSIIQPHQAMVITAFVPYSKQWEAYREAFKDAPGGQDPARDIPQYLAVWVDVLDVTDDPSMDPATATGWKRVDSKKLKDLEDQYGASVPELADPDAVDPKLTHPVPPFLLTDLRPVLLHPDVERATAVVQKFEEEADPEFIDTGEGFLMDDDAGGAATRGGGMNRGSGGMMPKGGKAGSSGFGGGSSGYNPYGGSGGKSRMSGSGGMGSGMKSGMGGGSFGGGGAINFETYRPVAKKLVRFVDFTAQAGRKYRYRVKLVLEDPNRPKDPDMEPEPTTLDDEVLKRIKGLEAAEAAGGQRRYFRPSDWSEPSDIVSMPSPERFYAGATIPGATTYIGGAAIPLAEPEAKVLAVTWDPKLGVFAPAEQSVHRASVLNVKADVEVIHPVQGDLRKVEGYELKTDGVVLDILGGEKLPGTAASKEDIRAPGETLIMDAEGNLLVTDESRDIEGYRKYIFPEPKKEEPKDKSKSDDTGMSSMGPAPGGSEGPRTGGSGSGKGAPSQSYPSGKGSKMPKSPKPGK